MLSQEYWDNIAQEFFMYSVVWSLLNNIAQGFACSQLVVWFTSANDLNLEFKNPTFLGWN